MEGLVRVRWTGAVGRAAGTRTLSEGWVRAWAAESRILRVLSLTRPSRLHY